MLSSADADAMERVMFGFCPGRHLRPTIEGETFRPDLPEAVILSDHFDGRHYFNPTPARERGLRDVLRWMLTRKRQPWPRGIVDPPQPEPPRTAAGSELFATFVNHSTFLLQMNGVNLLTDPIWSDRASPLTWAGPRRARRPGVPFERLPPIDVVLVSHNHYDHLDLPTLRLLESVYRPLFLTTLGNRRFLKSCGFDCVEELDWWQSFAVGPALEVILTPAQHFAARSLFDRNRTLWGGFLIRTATRTVYFAADTGYPGPFVEVRKRAEGIDLALLPFGAYEPRWFMGPVHMNPDDAVRAHIDLGGPFTLGMHYGTFQLTDEPIDEPERHLRIALAEHGVSPSRFRVPKFGETVRVEPRVG
jgi:L-ascorbate metabolism protein UlaG (beta-lactamase superfamily)